MRKRVRVAVLAAVLALALPMQSLAQEVPPEVEGAIATAEALLAQVEAAANEVAEATDEDPATVLETLLALELEIDPGDGSDPVPVSVAEAVNTIAGRTIIDGANHGGIFGLPEIAVGNVLHIGIDVKLDTWTGPLAAAPPEPDMGYKVATSGWTPDTPILPVLNPLFLTPVVSGLLGANLPPEASDALDEVLAAADLTGIVDLPPGASLPLLLTHMGGRLKHITWETLPSCVVVLGTEVCVQGLGTHSVGAGILGNNLDTAPRETSDGDPWPIWLPIVTGDGLSMLPDTQIDFVGYGEAIGGAGCTTTPSSGAGFNLPRVRTCIFAGALLGDGVAEFDGALDFGGLLAPLWEPPPPAVVEAIAVIDEIVATLPLGDVLDLLGLLDETPEIPV